MDPNEIYAQSIWEDGDVTELARVRINGADMVQADISTIVRTIYDVSADADSPTEIDVATTLTKASVVYDTLQEAAGTGRWTKDRTGYNFKDRVAAADIATGGQTLRVEYLFTGIGGEKFWVVYEHPIQAVFSS